MVLENKEYIKERGEKRIKKEFKNEFEIKLKCFFVK